MDENLEYAREMLLGRMLDLFIDFIDRFSIFRMDENLEYAREVLLGRRLSQFIDRFSIFQDG